MRTRDGILIDNKGRGPRRRSRDDAGEQLVEVARYKGQHYRAFRVGDDLVIRASVSKLDQGTGDEMTNGVNGRDPDAAVREQQRQTGDRQARVYDQRRRAYDQQTGLIADMGRRAREFWGKSQ